jgi:hypothetical protein
MNFGLITSMASQLRKFAVVAVALLVACSGYSTALASHAALRGEETDCEPISRLDRELAPGRQDNASRPGRGKHRSASWEVVSLYAIATHGGLLRPGAEVESSRRAAPEWNRRNGCGAFLRL